MPPDTISNEAGNEELNFSLELDIMKDVLSFAYII